MSTKKGFFYSVMMIAIISILAGLWLDSQHASNRLERAFESQEGALFLAYTKNELFQDLAEVTQVRVHSDGTRIKINGSLPAYNPSQALEDYNTFIQNWTSKSHINLTLDTSALEDGDTDIMIYNTTVRANYSDTPSNISLSNLTTDYLVINISAPYERLEVDDFSFGAGSTNLTFVYTDSNGTVEENGMVNLANSNTAEVTYVNHKSIIIRIIPQKRLEILSNVSDGTWEIEYNKSPDDIGVMGYPVELEMFYTQVTYNGGVYK